VSDLSFPPRKTGVMLWVRGTEMRGSRITKLSRSGDEDLSPDRVSEWARSACRQPRLSPPVAPCATPLDIDDHGRAEARRSTGSLREAWHAGGGTRTMQYPPVAYLATGFGRTAAPSALSPAGQWLEMAVECQDSGFPAMSEPQERRRHVTSRWQDVRRLRNDSCHSAGGNAGSGGIEGVSR
jgi:hypothetical protein